MKLSLTSLFPRYHCPIQKFELDPSLGSLQACMQECESNKICNIKRSLCRKIVWMTYLILHNALYMSSNAYKVHKFLLKKKSCWARNKSCYTHFTSSLDLSLASSGFFEWYRHVVITWGEVWRYKKCDRQARGRASMVAEPCYVATIHLHPVTHVIFVWLRVEYDSSE